MLFNEELYRVDKKLLDFNKSEFILRDAVRAIIMNKDKILMVFLEKTNEYKFPGGGINKNEKIEDALKREILEEAGYKIKNINDKIGTIVEYGIAIEDKNKIFKMISDYYSVDIEDKQFNQDLDNYEKELMFKPSWVEIDTAYKANKKIMDNKCESTSWIKRETRVLEILIEGVNNVNL